MGHNETIGFSGGSRREELMFDLCGQWPLFYWEDVDSLSSPLR